MAAARILLQNSKVLPHSLRRQILSPSAVNSVALGTVLNDRPSVGAPRQDHLSGPSPVPGSSSLWLQQLLETVNRQSPAFELSPRGRPVKNSDSEDEIEDLEKGSVSDSEWGDEFEDEGSDESDPDDFYNSDEEKDTDRVPKLDNKYLKDW